MSRRGEKIVSKTSRSSQEEHDRARTPMKRRTALIRVGERCGSFVTTTNKVFKKLV